MLRRFGLDVRSGLQAGLRELHRRGWLLPCLVGIAAAAWYVLLTH